MPRIVNQGLDGANCQLGGQSLISLSVTEDLDADYATAAAVCIATGGAHSVGERVQTVEGGVGTGYWVVEDQGVLKSGARTWRRRTGHGYAHIPWAVYRLRRAGYEKARGTLSRANLGSDGFPPKFWSTAYVQRVREELQAAAARGDFKGTGGVFEIYHRAAGQRTVASGSDIIRALCAAMGLSVSFSAQCPVVVDEYIPMNKPLITAVKEVASWSGCSVYLTRAGGIRIYDYQSVFARGGGIPSPAATLEHETHDALYPVTSVTVVGEHTLWEKTYVVPAGGTFAAGSWQWISKQVPVEWTEAIAIASGTKHVEERVEVREYSITNALAQKLARERLTRAALGSGIVRTRGPADGCQGIEPVNSKVFSVTRTLEWGGEAYRYDIEITAPYAGMSWPGNTPPEDTWT